jgi:NAD-dependent SIR2 family protein deacetylase
MATVANSCTWPFERPLSTLVEQLQFARSRGRRGALLVGAGCSVSAGIPTASGFVQIIRDQFPSSYDAANPKTYASCMARLTDAVQQELIKGFVDSATLNAASRGIGALISSSFIDRALTTNFDHLIMKACVGLNVWPGVYDYASSGVFVEERLHDKAIIHLHGKHDGIVLINTSESFRQHGTKIAPIIKECQKGRIWIVVGYSGENDPVFEQLCAVDSTHSGYIGYVTEVRIQRPG